MRVKVLGKPIAVRTRPEYPGERNQISVQPGEELEVHEKTHSVTYLAMPITFYELKDGRGWIFDFYPRKKRKLLEVLDPSQHTRKALVKQIVFEPGAIGIDYEGATICRIHPDSQAERLKVQVGWRIVFINGVRVEDNSFSICTHLERGKLRKMPVRVVFSIPKAQSAQKEMLRSFGFSEELPSRQISASLPSPTQIEREPQEPNLSGSQPSSKSTPVTPQRHHSHAPISARTPPRPLPETGAFPSSIHSPPGSHSAYLRQDGNLLVRTTVQNLETPNDELLEAWNSTGDSQDKVAWLEEDLAPPEDPPLDNSQSPDSTDKQGTSPRSDPDKALSTLKEPSDFDKNAEETLKDVLKRYQRVNADLLIPQPDFCKIRSELTSVNADFEEAKLKYEGLLRQNQVELSAIVTSIHNLKEQILPIGEADNQRLASAEEDIKRGQLLVSELERQLAEARENVVKLEQTRDEIILEQEERERLREQRTERLKELNDTKTNIRENISRAQQLFKQTDVYTATVQSSFDTKFRYWEERWQVWTVEEVASWIAYIDGGKYNSYHDLLLQNLVECNIVGAQIPKCNQQTLRSFGVSDWSHCEAIEKRIRKLTRKYRKKTVEEMYRSVS